MKETSRKLISKYGEEQELKKVLEEMNELASEIYRDMNHGEVKRMKILEERVDVELMLNMIDEIYYFHDKDIKGMWESKKKKINKKYLEG